MINMRRARCPTAVLIFRSKFVPTKDILLRESSACSPLSAVLAQPEAVIFAGELNGPVRHDLAARLQRINRTVGQQPPTYTEESNIGALRGSRLRRCHIF